ncbi:hypothetical protein TRVA0_031S00540 [Trichomonascus vanleenenianus]|uniref:Ypp1p n=1 Tax=Trichomonascus vanleenenianus TaxID=2268995 RepID=UPI003ECB41F7
MVSNSKAETYLKSLDEARGSSAWTRVPELARKVTKHSPEHASFARVAVLEEILYTQVLSMNSDRLAAQSVRDKAQLRAVADELKDIHSQTTGSTEDRYIRGVVYGHSLVLLAEYRSAIDLLTPLDPPSGAAARGYVAAAVYRHRAVLGMALEATSQFDEAIATYSATELVRSTESHETLVWAEVLYYRYSMLVTSRAYNDHQRILSAYRGYMGVSKSMRQLDQLPPAVADRQLRLLNAYLVFMSSLVQKGDPDGSREELQAISELYEHYLFSGSRLPTATDSNAAVEEYIDILIRDWKQTVPLVDQDGERIVVTDPVQVQYTERILSTLRKSALLTFHSCSIMRHHITVCAALGLFDEALLSFKTYEAYQSKFKLREETGGSLENASGDDDFSAIKAFVLAIELMITYKKDARKAHALAIELLEWIPSLRGSETEAQKNLVAAAYAAIADVNVFVSGEAVDYAKYLKHMSFALQSYASSLEINPNNTRVQVNYAVQLARSGRIAEAIQATKTGLIHNQSSIMGWHLLALLLSIHEEFDTAIKVINSAMGIELQRPVSDRIKHQVIQMKMTQVALIEASTGSSVALEHVPEVLALYAAMYPDHEDSNKEKPQDQRGRNASTPSVTSEKLAPTKSRISRLSRRSRSLRSHDRPTANNTNGTNGSINTGGRVAKLQKVTAGDGAKLLKTIWLWIAALYRRSGLYTEAEQAIIQAEDIYGPSAETRAELGILMSAERPVHALEEFEAALDEDGDNFRAALGFAHLVVQYSTSWGDGEGEGDGEENIEPPVRQLFLSERDELAGRSRALGLLDVLSIRRPGRTSSECFYLLSQLYERAARPENAQEALWKCIKFEEIRPVRDFACIYYDTPM